MIRLLPRRRWRVVWTTPMYSTMASQRTFRWRWHARLWARRVRSLAPGARTHIEEIL